MKTDKPRLEATHFIEQWRGIEGLHDSYAALPVSYLEYTLTMTHACLLTTVAIFKSQIQMKSQYEPISAQAAKTLRIDKQKNGITIWIKEADGQEHWLWDASMIKQDGAMRLGNDIKEYEHKAVYDKVSNSIQIVRRKNFKPNK